MKKITALCMLFLAFTFQGYSQFNESFEGGIPPTWTVVNGGDENTWETEAIDFPYDAHTGTMVAKIRYSLDAHDDYLITQQFTVTAGVSDRLTVWAGNRQDAYPEPFDILLSNTGNNTTDFTTTIAAQVNPTQQNWLKFSYDLSAYAGQTVYIAFHSTTTYMYELYLDDIKVDALPTVLPACITNPVSAVNPACGNFATTISWDALPEADGYRLTVGTTSGGTDIVNNQDIGLDTSYILNEQVENSTYYWKVVPYNIVGSAMGCTVNNYTTASTGCYCTPNPQTVDGLGISNVAIGTINNPTANEVGNYGDYSTMSTNVYRGLLTPFSITYETGYEYETKIWIDWNDDMDFSDIGEEVYAGISEADSSTTLSGVFMIPATAALGNHRMRIGGQYSGPVTPCFDGYYGTFEDYTVTVGVASCSQPAASTYVTFNCPANQFFVQVNVTDLGSGTPSITDGITTWPVTAVGNVQTGPFLFGSEVTLILQHGSNTVCNLPLGTITYFECPPANDECINAIALTPGAGYTSHVVDGSNLHATASQVPAVSCDGYAGEDVWYSIVVPASGSITIETGNTAGGADTGFDSVIALYSGTCGALEYIDCDDQGADIGNYSLKTVTGQTPGSTLYINVFEYFNDTITDFGIAAYDASLSSPSFETSGLSVYPNPVKDVLHLSYTSDISAVTIVNLLGQEMLKKNIDASQSEIDLSDLANGTYLVKMEVGDLIKTMKIIKTD
ncbi:choice-of-anchor J domain-containing protein [Flavobacterium sp.]|uniref:choice-of-anchor J domain-containing protein n=1 Tax=Flavobacterium sp. TaxID=239 RepID=UPI003D6A8105